MAQFLLLLTALILATATLVTSFGIGFTMCEDDFQCGPFEYCYESGLCVPCLECAAYHRYNLTTIQCAKEVKHCGGCVEGWKDDIFLNGDRRDSCKPDSRGDPSRPVPPEHYTADPALRFAQLGEFLIIAVTASVFFIGGFLWCRNNWTKPSRILPTHNLLPAEPAPCRHPTRRYWDLSESVSHTSLSSSDAGQREVVHTTIFTAEGFKDAPQQAIPFLRPRYEMENDSDVETEELQEPQSPDMSFLHDQDTLPSNWTPQANESTSSNDTTSSITQEASASSDGNSNDSQPPQAKRLRVSHSESDSGIDVFNPIPNQDEDQSSEETGINFYITNNVVIRKS